MRKVRTTTRRARLVDGLARWWITIGGLITVISVLGVFAFLLYVAFPLLLPARWESDRPMPLAEPAAVAALAADEHRDMMAQATAGGVIHVLDIATGRAVAKVEPFAGQAVTALQWDPAAGMALAAFSNGAAALAAIRFDARWEDAATAPAAVRDLPVGGVATTDGAAWRRVEPNRFRVVRLQAEVVADLDAVRRSPVLRADFIAGPEGEVNVLLHADGAMEAVRTTRKKNLLTGQVSTRATVVPIAWRARPEAGSPMFLGLSGIGDAVYLVWRDGVAQRYDIRGVGGARLTEERQLVEPPATVTAVGFLLGRTTLLVGDSFGRVRPWFVARLERRESGDAPFQLVNPREFAGPSSPVTALAASPRSRMFAAGFANGDLRVWHATSGKRLDVGRPAGDGPVRALAFCPKEDGLLAVAGSTAVVRGFLPRHPEVTLRSLFRRVWYEGAPGPAHVWQSSSGTDDFEPKYGMMPLVFGTIKATLVAMALAVPLALLAALYTSQFMKPRWKSVVKPTLEMMAALPSVVLGFLAALVLAPWVSAALPATLAALATVPLCAIGLSYLWQMLPVAWMLRLSSLRLLAVAAAIAGGLAVSPAAGRAMERAWFAGDLMRWLDGQIGGPFGGWFMILFPLALAGAAALFGAAITPRIRRRARNRSDFACAVLDVARFLAQIATAAGLAWTLAALLSAAGADPRGWIVGTYVQRNALVVGFAMGFAIIPLIFTIAEDAFSAVPEHLRSASLSAGATPWQTAVRIVVPAAAGGVFSAVMVGLGRAVGETMIVLMAAGNTPIMDWNIFNGFRTLSANIAVELPEAVRNSTHYRTLFLASLVLFVMTFTVNTAAETVRLRVRRKLKEL